MPRESSPPILRPTRAEATLASRLVVAAAPGVPRIANRRGAPALRLGSMRRRGCFSRARAAKRANPRSSSSPACLRQIIEPFGSWRSVEYRYRRALLRLQLAPSPLPPISTICTRSIRTCQSRNARIAIAGGSEMPLERPEGRNQYAGGSFLADPAAIPTLLERPFL